MVRSLLRGGDGSFPLKGRGYFLSLAARGFFYFADAVAGVSGGGVGFWALLRCLAIRVDMPAATIPAAPSASQSIGDFSYILLIRYFAKGLHLVAFSAVSAPGVVGKDEAAPRVTGRPLPGFRLVRERGPGVRSPSRRPGAWRAWPACLGGFRKSWIRWSAP